MAAQPSLELAPPLDDSVRMRLVQSLPPHTLQALLAIEQDAFPVCERLGRHAMVEHAACRANGLLVAEPPLPASEPEPSPMGFLLYSRTADAGVVMKLAVAAAFRGRGVGRALLRCGISELRRPARRASPSAIMLHVDPARAAARGLYSMGKVAASVGPQLATMGFSDCTLRRGAALRTHGERLRGSEPTETPWRWSQVAPKSPSSPRLTIRPVREPWLPGGEAPVWLLQRRARRAAHAAAAVVVAPHAPCSHGAWRVRGGFGQHLRKQVLEQSNSS